MDKLDAVFERQRALAANFIPIAELEKGDLPRDKHLLTYISLLIEETVELQRTINSRKFWRAKIGARPINMEEFRDELADVLHIVVAIALIAGLSPEDLFNDYVRKNEINKQRVIDDAS